MEHFHFIIYHPLGEKQRIRKYISNKKLNFSCFSLTIFMIQ